MAGRPALGLLALSALAALVASCLDASWSPWLMAFAAATFPVALMALGMARGRIGWLRWPLLGLWLILAGGWATLLALPHGGEDLGSLPTGTAIMLFVLVPVPFVIVCWAYARSFSSLGLREEDLARLRRLREERQSRDGKV